MYFNIEEIQPYVEEYAKYYFEDREKAMAIYKIIHNDILQVISGVIFTHKLHAYAEVDILKSVAIEALLSKSGLCKFDASYTGFKGKQENLLFSYISLIAKRSMQFHTIRDKLRREQELSMLDDWEPVYFDKEEESTLLEDSDVFIRPKFKGTRFEKCYDYLIQYLKINGRLNKREFFGMVLQYLNTENDLIPRIKTRKDVPNYESRARATIRKTLKLYKIYLNEYLVDNRHFFAR